MTNVADSDWQPIDASVNERGLVSVILATFQERDHIRTTIAEIFEHVEAPVEIIVVDDDSPDMTWRLVEEFDDPNVHLIRRLETRGLASAFMRGIIESKGEVVAWMDSDMCMPPAHLAKMIDKLADYDVVIGSRYAEGGKDLRTPIRVWASRLINKFANLVLGYGIKDYDSGFVALRREVLDKVIPLPTGYGEYFIEFIYRCCRKGLRVCELPYTFTDRAMGVSKTFSSFRQFLLLGSKYVLRILLTRFRRFD